MRKVIGYTRRGVPIYEIRGASPAATVSAGRSNTPTQAPAGVGVIPFARAANQYAEQFANLTGLTLGASTVEQQPQPVIPGGFLRGIWLHLSTTTAGSTGTATFPAVYPFNIITSVTLEDINGAPIIGPLTGYELYLANKYFGYFDFPSDAKVRDGYAAGLASPNFSLWIPCEIRSDGLGSLANTDARAQYRVRITTNSMAGAVLVQGTGTTPTFKIQMVAESWSQVEATSQQGIPQEQLPPALGTTQFITHESSVITSGQSLTLKHNRVGNLIRNHLYYFLDATAVQPALVDVLTDPVRLRLDNAYLRIEPVVTRQRIMAQDFGLAPAASTQFPLRDTGVYVYPRSRGIQGRPGPGDDGDWLGTTEASYLALEVTLSAFTGPGTVTILTNDIAPRGDIPLPSEY